MKRLHWVFLAVLALVASLAFVQVDDTSSDVAYTLTVLHNNDGESQLVNAGSGLEDFGGVARFARLGEAMGFKHVASGPMVRSSYHAEQQAAASHRTPGWKSGQD